jgi:lipoate---protein ligase
MRCLEHTFPEIARNLALDEALLIEAEEGAGPVLRIWESPELVVVLGASGRWSEDIDVEACQADGVGIARRSSGGGTVLIGPGALSAAVVLPVDLAPGLEAVDVAQRFVLEQFAQGLKEINPQIEVLGSGDLVLGGRKFAGSAQRRLRRHFLVHVSILYAFPIDRIGRYLHMPRRQPEYRQGRPHEEFLTNLEVDRSLLIRAVRSAWLPPSEPIVAAPVPEERVRALVAAKFADRAWIERL